MAVLLAYFLMTYAGIGVAMQCRDAYGRFLAVGIVAIIFCPAMLNIAGKPMPCPTRLPLPFISFGGTNLVFTLAALGMLTSIQRFSTGAQPNPPEITRKDERSIDVRL